MLAIPAVAAGTVTGTIVYEAQPAVYDYVTDPTTGETTTMVVSYPVYEPVEATVTAYGPGQGGAPAKAVASVVTNADGTFSLAVPVDSVYLQVTPTSADWQSGWLWVEHMTDDPMFASYLQRRAPEVFDVTPPMDVGKIQVQSAVASGRVVDADTGQPIAGARVTYDPVLGRGKLLTATTDANGYYVLNGLDYEEYHIRATASRYIGGYLGMDNLLYKSSGESSTWGTGPLPGDVIKMVHR